MIEFKHTVVLALLVTGLAICNTAQASQVTYTFTGNLTDIRQSGAGFSYGNTFTASYFHDDILLPVRLIEPGRALFSGGQFTINSVDRDLVGPANSELQVFDNWNVNNADGFFISSYIYDTNNKKNFFLIQFDLWDFSQSILSSLSIPNQQQIEELAHNGRIFIRRFENGTETGLASGNFSQFTPVSSVPVPAAFWLFASGLGLLTFNRRNNGIPA